VENNSHPRIKVMPLTFKPLTTRTWEDLQTLFGENGACGGCWCMYWRCTHKEYEKNKGTINKANLQKLVTDGLPLGVLVFDGDRPAGWCSISPRESLVRLQNSRLFKPIDEEPVWSISCLYVKKNYRRKGLSQQLIRTAADYAFEEGLQQ